MCLVFLDFFHRKIKISGLPILTTYSDTLLLVASVPRLQFTRLATVVHLLTARTRRESDPNRPSAFVAILDQWLPAKTKMLD